MRKIIHRYTVLLLTVLLVGTGIALADTDVIVLGDVNSDGSVNTADVTALVNYLHGSGTVNLTAADANRDNAVDIADVTAINNIITSGTSDKGTTSKLFFPATTVEKTYGDAAFTNQLVRSGSTGAITYESSVPGVATVNETTGDVTIQGAGTTIITATLAGNGGISGTTASYTVNVAKVAASITTSPASVAGDLTYDGTAQNLVTAGDASGGTLKYFVNTSGEVPTTETDGWTDVVSTGTDADTYYVWYYVAGDANHTNTAVTAIEGNTKAISKFNLTNAAIATEIGDQQYAGAQVTPAAPAIKLGESTIDASNYDVSYGENNSVGTGTVIYTAKAGSANFSGAKIVNFTITSGTLSVTAEDYSGTYDGAAHGITVTCDGATIKYRTTAEGEYNLTENPTYTNAGTVQTVYYQVTKDNYTTVEGSKTVTITQKEVTVSDITASNKTYDGTTTATLVYTGATISGKVGSDELTVTATGTFDDANVGTDKTVTISDITLGGSSAANYKLATSGNQTSTTANITAASFTPVVTLSGWTYGSPNDPSVGETNTSGGTVTYYYKTGDAEWTTTQPTDAGTHQVKASIAASGNYAAAESSPVDFTITQKEVTVSGITASNKTYDGNTTATLVYTSVSIDGKVGEDDLTVTATGTFDDANVGTGKTVTISGITLGGSSAANYKLAASGNQTSTTANITVASFTPVVTLSGWTYGSPNDPSVGETNTSGGTVTYYYKTGDAEWTTTQPTDAGTHKVKASIAANGNYAAAESSPVDFTITQKEVTVSGITASNKTYDGNTTATLVYTGATITGKVGSDDLTVTATGTFADANVGTGKNVTISGITLGGSSAANYTLAASGNQESTTADITAASFTPVVTLSGWTYGSPNSPSVGETNTSGGTVTYYYKTGDAEWTTTQPTDVGTHKVKASIAANGNYAAAESAEVEFTVTQKALTITAKAQTISYGSSIATGTGQVTADGLVAGDALTAVILAASTDQVTTSGIITPSAATTTKGIGNYSVTYNTGTLTINKVAASVTTAPMGKTSLTYTGEAQELVDATSAASTGGTLVYSKTENGTYGAASTITETNAGTYSFWYKVLGDGNHDDSTPVQITGVVIGKKEVTVSGITAENKTYDGTTTATLVYTGATITGKVGSDELTVTATGTFEDANVGTGKTVTISGITLGGAKAGNYILAATGNQTSTTANIIYTSMSDATQDDIGKVICSNGHIHSNVSDVTCGGSASAMIAYVGNKSNCTYGLAIALEDVSSNSLTWGSGGIYNDSKTAAEFVTNWGSSHSVTGGTWRLPSVDDWKYMFQDCGGASYSSSTTYSYGDFREKLKALNTSYDVRSDGYWSSTENRTATDYAWFYGFGNSCFNDYGAKYSRRYVRAVCAF